MSGRIIIKGELKGSKDNFRNIVIVKKYQSNNFMDKMIKKNMEDFLNLNLTSRIIGIVLNIKNILIIL